MTAILLSQAVFANENPLGELSVKQAGILLAGCVCDSVGLMSMCIAFQVASTSVVCMVGYLAIVYAILTDIFIFGDSLGKVELFGCGAVILITLSVGYYKYRKGDADNNPQTNKSSRIMQMTTLNPMLDETDANI